MQREKNETRPSPTGKQIRKALIDLDISVMELAAEMGVSAYYIREIYAERRKAREMRGKIARYLGKEYRKRQYQMPKWMNNYNNIKERVA